MVGDDGREWRAEWRAGDGDESDGERDRDGDDDGRTGDPDVWEHRGGGCVGDAA